MKSQKFEALGVEIPIKDRYFFHGEGVVESIKIRMGELVDQHGAKFEDYWNPSWNPSWPKGLCCSFDYFGENHTHIMCLPAKGIVRDCYLAHEEVHAINNFRQGRLFNQKIIDEFGLSPDVWLGDWGEEGFAARGSLVPLIRKGFTPSKSLKILADCGVYLVVPYMEASFLEPFLNK